MTFQVVGACQSCNIPAETRLLLLDCNNQELKNEKGREIQM